MTDGSSSGPPDRSTQPSVQASTPKSAQASAQPPADGEVHELPFGSGANAAARALLAAFAERQRLGQQVRQDAVLVLGELVANGVDHGRPDTQDGLEVSWHLDGVSLRLSVYDGGGTSVPHVVRPDPYAPRGRGLAMVAALSSSWWFDGTRGTRVTAVIDVR